MHARLPDNAWSVDCAKTSLQSYMSIFQAFLTGLEEENAELRQGKQLLFWPSAW